MKNKNLQIQIYTDSEAECYARCECGAIGIYINDKQYFCDSKNFKKYFPNIDLRRIEKLNSYCHCDHCVNNWGVDLCGCGSGEAVGKCDNNFEECEYQSQVVNSYTNISAKHMWG